MKNIFNWMKHLKSTFTLSILTLLIIFHFILMSTEIKSIENHVFDYSQKISGDIDRAIQSLDLFSLRKSLMLVKDDRISYLKFSSEYLGKNNMQALLVGDYINQSLFVIEKSKPIFVNGSLPGILSYSFNLLDLSKFVFKKNIGIYLFLVLIFSMILYSSNLIFIRFIEKLAETFKSALDFSESNGVDSSTPFFDSKKITSILKSTPPHLKNSFNKLFNTLDDFFDKEKQYTTAKITVELSKQVSHDIRSPLAALSMLLNQLETIPEEKRILIRSSVHRINDIANSLLNQGKMQSSRGTSNHISLENTLVASLVDSLVSEKRIQLRDRVNIRLESQLQKSYGLFSKINPVELKRTLSNIINNAVEAFGAESGTIDVILNSTDSNIVLTIRDNGKGIPKHILEKLGQIGVTHGKEGTDSGSGLGVYHAKKTIESFGGQFEIVSSEGQGTSVVMTLSKESPPTWFVQNISLKKNQYIIASDDDCTILEIWKQRFADTIKSQDIFLVTCASGACLKDWILNNKESSVNALYLIDYEFLGQKQNGLDLIEELKIAANSILVSSRYEETQVKGRCDKLGVRMIPKGMVSLVPVTVEKEKQVLDGIVLDDDPLINRPIITQNSSTNAPTLKVKYDLCLLDDDRDLIQAIWGSVAKSNGLNIKMFSTPSEFFAAADAIDRQTPIYVDVSLGNGIKGTDVAKDIHKLGFIEINLATGYEADSLDVPPFISRVCGKDFPIGSQ